MLQVARRRILCRPCSRVSLQGFSPIAERTGAIRCLQQQGEKPRGIMAGTDRLNRSGLVGRSVQVLACLIVVCMRAEFCQAGNFIPGPVILLGVNSDLGWWAALAALLVGTLVRGGVYYRSRLWREPWRVAAGISMVTVLLAWPSALIAAILLNATSEVAICAAATLLLLLAEIAVMGRWQRRPGVLAATPAAASSGTRLPCWFWCVTQSSLLTSLLLLGVSFQLLIWRPSASLTAVRCHLNRGLLDSALQQADAEQRTGSESQSLIDAGPLSESAMVDREKLLPYLPSRQWPECVHGFYELDETVRRFRCTHPEHGSR